MKKKWVLRHCDLDLWPKVTKFNRVWASVLSKRLAKIASKSVHPFDWNFVHKNNWTDRQTDRHTDTHTDKLQWKYNPSTISWRCNNDFIQKLSNYKHFAIDDNDVTSKFASKSKQTESANNINLPFFAPKGYHLACTRLIFYVCLKLFCRHRIWWV